MIKLSSIICYLLLFCASLGIAETIDVNIKGVDDGVKTSKQQDYSEAVMNAKLQAIEQAGASIESITKVLNFQLKYDAVESKSKAILLPGFQIIDIGYLADGTYQVVLIGKIQVGDKGKQAKEIDRDFPFIAYDNRTVLNAESGLMWAAKDNGGDIKWTNAKSYCENYRGGGYSDWRMPTHEELAGLYDANKSRPGACNRSYNIHVKTELIDISCLTVWASDTRGSEAANFYFYNGGWSWYHQSYDYNRRALPVRSGK